MNLKVSSLSQRSLPHRCVEEIMSGASGGKLSYHSARRVQWLALFLVLASALAFAQENVNPLKADPAQVSAGPVINRSSIDFQFGDQAAIDRMGNTYVPIDSWIYPAFDRLISYGYITSAFQGQRPWTHATCVRLLAEAAAKIKGNPDVPEAAVQIYLELQRALVPREIQLSHGAAIGLDSIYTRVMGISGTPVNDSYHFGQTIINDYGRPYAEGFNNVTGFTASAHAGRFAWYVNGEYQHAPPSGAYPLLVRQVIATVDNIPVPPANPIPTRNQFRLLDTYVSANLAGLNFSVGKQSLWWGPSRSGPMLMSNNAVPLWMFRINRTDPFYIPGLSRIFGKFRYDSFFGKLSEHNYPPEPYMYGQKISFKPTDNLEVGFARTAVFAGKGHVPLTFGSFFNSFFSVNDVPAHVKFSRSDPGARFSEFDVSYRIPGIRQYATFYLDSLVHDDVSPISAPNRSAINPGLYISHFPRLHNLDLRIEAVNTDPPDPTSLEGRFMYWEVVYRDAYTNRGNIMGNWVGREGKGYQVWSTYWLSPKSSIQVSFRNSKVAKDFIPGGTTQNDFTVSTNFWTHRNVQVQGLLQYENWMIPLLSPTRQSNVTSYVQVTFWPEKFLQKLH